MKVLCRHCNANSAMPSWADLTFLLFKLHKFPAARPTKLVGEAPAKFVVYSLIAASHGTCGASPIKPSPRTGLIVRE